MLRDLKATFVRRAVEEILRRSFNTEKEAEKIVTTLLDHLHQDHNSFVGDLFERKKAQMLKELDPGSNKDSLKEMFQKYESRVKELKEKFGYLDQTVGQTKNSQGIFVIDENGFSVW